MIWDGSNPFLAIASSLLIVGASSIHYHARPHAVTLLLFPLCLWMIDADRRRHSRWIWLLIPITVVWTNMHGAFLALIACLGLLVLGVAVEAFLSWRTDRAIPWRDPARYAILLAACSAATSCGPNAVFP